MNPPLKYDSHPHQALTQHRSLLHTSPQSPHDRRTHCGDRLGIQIHHHCLYLSEEEEEEGSRYQTLLLEG